jgi:hypothetical protein
MTNENLTIGKTGSILFGDDYGPANYTISKVPAYFSSSDENAEKKKSSSHYCLRRDDRDEDLGWCGKNFQIVQPKMAVNHCRELLLDSSLNLLNVRESIAASPSGDMLAIKYQFPETVFNTPEVSGARLDNGRSKNSGNLSLLCLTSVNGKWSFQLSLGFNQSACLNGQIFISDAVSRYKHKHDQCLDIVKAGQIIATSADTMQREVDLWHKFRNTPISNETVKKLFVAASGWNKSLDELDYNLQKKGKSGNKNYDYLRDQMSKNYLPAMGQNAWSAYNAVTHWSSHAPIPARTNTNTINVVAMRRDNAKRAISNHLLPLAA